VGAPNAEVNAVANQGAAYVFLRSGNSWLQQAKLIATDGAADDNFGHSAAIRGSTVLIGAPKDNVTTSTDQGSAYVFLRTGTAWAQQAQLTATDGAASDNFGQSVALDGDYALVGANLDNVGTRNDQGSAYVFLRTGTTWAQQAQLLDPLGTSLHQFGFRAALDGDYALVGGYNGGLNNGVACLYKRDGTSWAMVRRIVPLGPLTLRNGNAVGLDGARYGVGSSGFDTSTGKVTFGSLVD
jgi:hypothetical protein